MDLSKLRTLRRLPFDWAGTRQELLWECRSGHPTSPNANRRSRCHGMRLFHVALTEAGLRGRPLRRSSGQFVSTKRLFFRVLLERKDYAISAVLEDAKRPRPRCATKSIDRLLRRFSWGAWAELTFFLSGTGRAQHSRFICTRTRGIDDKAVKLHLSSRADNRFFRHAV
jgi:hypothetical protein